jgi:hypothetical protein
MGVLNAHHIWNAHQGVERLVPDLELHYVFPDEIDVPASVAKIRRECLVCQACLPPNWALKGPIGMSPIPPRVMSSVCLDVFAMPEATW